MGSQIRSSAWRIAPWSSGDSCVPRRDRLVLVESLGWLRDGLVSSISSRMPGAVVEGYGRVEDVTPGPTKLLLIGLDPRLDGDVRAKFDALRVLCGDASIGVVLASDDKALMRAVGALGVVGVLTRAASLEVAMAAVQLMWVGGFYLPPELSRDDESARAPSSPLQPAALQPVPLQPAPLQPPVLRSSPLGVSLAPPEHEPIHREADSEFALTSRECDVLRILREGRQNKIIAFELGISESTVKVHLRNIMKKLHVSNRTQVALGAVPAE